MKFVGKVGYAVDEETKPGIWKHKITEKDYVGDIIQLSTRWLNTSQVNEEISMANKIEIIADPFAFGNFSRIRYVEYMGQKWRVTSATPVGGPRISLNVGGVWNGDEA